MLCVGWRALGPKSVVPRTPSLVSCSLGLSRAPSLHEERWVLPRGWEGLVVQVPGPVWWLDGGEGGKEKGHNWGGGAACWWQLWLFWWLGRAQCLPESGDQQVGGPGFPVPHQLLPWHRCHPLQTQWAGARGQADKWRDSVQPSLWGLGTHLTRQRCASHAGVTTSPQVRNLRGQDHELSLL